MRPENTNPTPNDSYPQAPNQFPSQEQATPVQFPATGPSIPEPAQGQGLIPSLPDVNNTAQPVKGFSTRRGKKKTFIIAGIATLAVLLGGSAAAYYGIIEPNKPENIWKTALERTATGYDRLVASDESYKGVKGANITGNYKMSGEFATDGTVDIKTYENNATFKFDVGAITTRVNVEGKVIASPNSKNPDIYLKATGLKGFGATLGPDYGQLLEQFDGQWYVIDHTLLDNIQAGALSEGGTAPKPVAWTADDAVQVEKAVGEVNRQYLFTTDPNKAVFTVVENVGKEKRDDRSVYHYRVGLHKQHTKDYVNALVDRLQNTPVTKLIDGKKLRDVVDMNELMKSIDKYKEADTADVYVDLETKLVRNVRIEDKIDKANYFELAMPYTGGDVFPMTVTLQGSNDSSKQIGKVGFKVNSDMKQYKSDVTVDFDIPTGTTPADKSRQTGTAKFTMTENKDALDIEKPVDAKSLNELLSGLFSQTSGGSVDGPALSEDLNDLLEGSSSI